MLSLPGYAALAAVGAAAGLTAVAGNRRLVADLVFGGALSLPDRAAVLVGLYPGASPAFSAVQAAVLLAVAGLLGVVAALLGYHVREHGVAVRGAGGGVAGAALATLGAGCAACGTAVLAGVLSAAGAAGAVTVLPLEGLEFALLALGSLVLSVHWFVRGGEVAGYPVEVRVDHVVVSGRVG